MPTITGRVEILVNGFPLLNKAGAIAGGIGLSGLPNYTLREVVGIDGRIDGFIEEPVLATLDVTVTDRDDVSLNQLAEVRENGTILFQSIGGGKVYMMNKATCTRNFQLTSGEGAVNVRFVGDNWIENTQ